METIKLPSPEECLEYFEYYKVPGNIKAHCLAVQKTAIFLARELNHEGAKINVTLLNCLTVFHDMFKAATIDYDDEKSSSNRFHNHPLSAEEYALWQKLRTAYPNMNETQIAQEVLKVDYPELAALLVHEKQGHTPEQALSNYCDWITLKDEVVTLKERLLYLLQAYPEKKMFYFNEAKKIKEYEKEIFAKLNFPPEELKVKIADAEVETEVETEGKNGR